MLNPVTRAYAGPFRGRIRGRKEKRPLIGVTRGRSKIVMLNALCEMRMRMGNVNRIQCCSIPIFGTNQMQMTFSFAFGGGFGSHPDWPHSHLGKLGPNRPRPLNGLRLVSGFNNRAIREKELGKKPLFTDVASFISEYSNIAMPGVLN